MRLPRHIAAHVRHAEAKGHRMTSQGCSLFRCLRCDMTRFMDDAFSDSERCVGSFFVGDRVRHEDGRLGEVRDRYVRTRLPDVVWVLWDGLEDHPFGDTLEPENVRKLKLVAK